MEAVHQSAAKIARKPIYQIHHAGIRIALPAYPIPTEAVQLLNANLFWIWLPCERMCKTDDQEERTHNSPSYQHIRINEIQEFPRVKHNLIFSFSNSNYLKFLASTRIVRLFPSAGVATALVFEFESRESGFAPWFSTLAFGSKMLYFERALALAGE